MRNSIHTPFDCFGHVTPLTLTNPRSYQILPSVISLGMMFGILRTRSKKEYEEFPNQQESMPPLLAQKENWKGPSFLGCKYYRKDHPYFWERVGAGKGCIGIRTIIRLPNSTFFDIEMLDIIGVKRCRFDGDPMEITSVTCRELAESCPSSCGKGTNLPFFLSKNLM